MALNALLIQNMVGRYFPVTRTYVPTSAIIKGSPGHFTLDTGMTIGEFDFIVTGTTNAEAEHIHFDVKLNNESIIELNGAEVHKFMRDYHGRKVQAGRFTIPLADMLYRTKEGIQSAELVTLPSDRLIIHVKFGTEIVGTPGIELRLRETPSQPVRYFVPRIFSSSFDLLSSGRNKWKFPRFGVDKFIRRIHFQMAGINAVNIFQSDKVQNEMKLADNNYDLENIGKKTPQANTFTVDSTMYGLGLDGLQTTINKLQYELDVANAGKVDYMVEMLEQVKDLPVAKSA